MKLQNLSVIFIIIVLPIILVLAYYMSLQADTLNLQAAYNTKLLDSTKEAIDAFEINTVEWNANYSETADSKRRDVMASINTFTNSFANNLGVSGTSKEYILANVPAIAFTLYDGYYIYSPADTKVTIKDENGLTIFYKEKLLSDGKITGCTYDEKNENKILYKPKSSSDINGYYNGQAFTLNIDDAEIEYSHILKPFTSYSENVETESGDKVVINYTLDNYVTLYGKMKDTDGETKYVSRGGYLTDLDKIGGVAGYKGARNITFDGKKIEPEALSEVITYKEMQDGIVTGIKKLVSYVYEAEGNTKVYIDDSEGTPKFFILNKDLERVYVEELSKPLYKKYTYPKTYSSGITTYIEIYQKLSSEDTNWYKRNEKGEYVQISASDYGVEGVDVRYDFSAINYCVESYVFTKWINSLGLKLEDGTILKVDNTNDPENEDSDFTNHKKEIIKEVVTSNLNQAITSYSRNSSNGDYYLPELTQTDWDQILSNVSIITFVQNIPIGLKYYNNYAIATSTVNKEYVNPNEIYLYDKNNNKFDDATGTYIENTEGYYHIPYCNQLEGNKLIGYRSIDFIKKTTTFGKNELGQEVTEHYYKHEPYVTQICYNCLVQRSEYDENKTDIKQKAYYTALARERYIARMSKLPSEVEPSYSFYVLPIDENDPTDEFGKYKVLSGAKYTIKDSKNVFGEETYVGDSSYKIKKSDVNNEFTITSKIEGNKLEDASGKLLPKGDYGSLDVPKNTITEKANYSVYESDAETKINIMQYDTEYLKFNVNAKNTIYEVKQTGKNYPSVDIGDASESGNYEFSLDDDGNIFIYLKYRKNYESSATASLKAYANINDYGDLTIATQIKEITGKVVLKFYNQKTSKTYWSENAFEVEDGSIVYCRIGGDGSNAETSWYEENWKVYVCPVDCGSSLAEGNVEYYTIRDEKGLKGFADAVNGTKGPSIGAITEARIFRLIADIPNVGTMAPIAGKSGKWFNGTFEGENHTISGITIDTNVNTYNAFGLFGWVGAPAIIEDLNISNINIDLNGKDQKENYRAGGFAAYCDTNGSSSITNIHVNNSTIKGTTWVGGIIGENKKYLDNCSLTNSNVYSVGKTNDGIGEIYLGGIVGKTNNLIKNANVNNSIIGSSNITVKTSSNKNIFNDEWNRNKYYVGGIAGYTQSTLEGTIIVNDSTQVKGGKVTVSSTDENAETYTGGIIGYKDSSQEVNVNLQTNCIVSGHDNVGGVIGYNAGGKISGITRTQTVIATGDNVGGIVGQNNSGSIEKCTNTSTVTGEQDIGGIIGRNEGTGAIKNCTNKGLVTATKESAGGIIGSNETGVIENCANENTITINNSQATNVGGIAGYNKGSITDCDNKASIQGNAINVGGIVGYMKGGSINTSINHDNVTVQGKKNVGGIGGITYGTHINDCYNKGSITGQDNTLFTGSIDLDNLRGPDWNVEGADYTGTGGITGKLYGGSINRCYNDGKISCNRNGGGITGVDFGGAIRYCYNSKGSTISNNNSGYNRLGGICGSGFGVDIYGCYNVGTVTGNSNGTAAADACAGIVGYLIDDCWLPTTYFTEIDLLESLPLTITIPEPGIYKIENKVSYCYNGGKISANEANGGINGYIMFGTYLNNKKSTFVYNYYLNTSASTGIGRTGVSNTECVSYEDKAFKEQLYKWATLDNVPKEGSTKIYNTTAPLEIDLGYQGYGILWWQIPQYVNLTSKVFMCNRVKLDNGTYTDTYLNFGNTAYNQAIHINGATINFRDIGFSICKDTTAFANNKPVTNGSGCYKWVMMVPKGNYSIKATTDFSKKSQVFINNQMLTPEGEEYNINVQNNTQIYVAPIIEMIEAKLKAKNITVVWERVETEVEAESKLFSEIYDANHNKINKVPAYYEKDPNGSKATISNGGKTVSVYLDKYDQIVKNQPICFHRFEYYTRELVKPSIWAWDWYYRYNGPNVVSEGTDSGKDANAKEASCTIYIDIENLVDLLGNDTAKRYIPHIAKVNMDYNINMWFDAGDFGSLFTNIFSTKDSNLEWNIAIQKYSNGNWLNIQSIPSGETTSVTNDNNELVTSFPKDGYYTVSKDIFNQDISGSLVDVKYNDRLRVAIQVKFESVSAHSYFNIDTLNKPVLDITYGPNIIE